MKLRALLALNISGLRAFFWGGLLAASTLAACDTLSLGVPDPASGTPTLLRVVVSDRYRNLATDLLEVSAPVPSSVKLVGDE